MRAIKIFISSPGDVELERQIARRVIGRLQTEFGQEPAIEPYFWEYEPMRLTKDFQSQIPTPSSFDIVVCILWSRLGTPLGPQHGRADGTPYHSGTEYEFEDAVAGNEKNGVPDILVYRNMVDPPIKPRPKEVRALQLAQIDALDTFLDRWTRDGETIKGALTKYSDLAQFEDLLSEHLRKIVRARRPSDRSASKQHPANWTSGSPFRGLEPFQFEHAPIFRGRTRAIQDVIGLLRAQRAARQAWIAEDQNSTPPPIFGLVSARSGIGKSSLIRAGVMPLLTSPGVIEGIAIWRHALMKPTGKASGLMAALSEALTAPEALPELLSDGTVPADLAQALLSNPASAASLVKGGLSQAAAKVRMEEEAQLRQWESEYSAKGRAADVQKCRIQREALTQRPAALALFIDQLEEVFTASDKNAEDERNSFFMAVDTVARSGRVMVLATLRSDFFPRLEEAPLLMELVRSGALYQLEPPTRTELAQIIREPAREAGLTFEEDAEGSRLDDVLLAATEHAPAALPLLEFTLDRLYHDRVEATLTHAAYRKLNGVEGAIALTAEREYAALSDQAKDAFGRLFGALVNLADVHQEERPVRRSALTDELHSNGPLSEFIDRFARARLLVFDQDTTGHQSVSVVHEALFLHWERLRDWIAENRELLRIRGRVEDAARLWDREGRPRDLLLVGGRALSEAQDLLGREQAITLTPVVRDFVTASAARSRAVQRWRRIAAAVVIAALSIAGVVTYYERKATQESLVETKLIEYRQAVRDAETAFLGRTTNVDSLRSALEKTLRVSSLRDEVTEMRGSPPESWESDNVRLLEFSGFLRAELGDPDGSLRDLRTRDELVKNGAKAETTDPVESPYLRTVLELQFDLATANDHLVAACRSDPKYMEKALQDTFGVKFDCVDAGKLGPEELARGDLERMHRFSGVLDYLTRAHPTEGDFTLLLQLLARQGRDHEILSDWSEAQRIWSERVDVAKRRLDWEQQKKNSPYTRVSDIANKVGGRYSERRKTSPNIICGDKIMPPHWQVPGNPSR